MKESSKKLQGDPKRKIEYNIIPVIKNTCIPRHSSYLRLKVTFKQLEFWARRFLLGRARSEHLRLLEIT